MRFTIYSHYSDCSNFQTNLFFLVYDRDRNWQGLSDDFMGSCPLNLTAVSRLGKSLLIYGMKYYQCKME